MAHAGQMAPEQDVPGVRPVRGPRHASLVGARVTFVGGEGAGRRAACTKKKRHDTPAGAYAALRALVAKGAYGPSLKVRQCWFGKVPHWHVMHRITKGRKGKRSR